MRNSPLWPSMDLLQDLDVLLELRHVTHAAKKRGITQSAMSARLGKLREFFADPLLVDARPKLLLTARAQGLKLPLRAALAQIAGVISQTKAFDPRHSDRTFVIVGGDAAEVLAVPRLLGAFREGYPGLKLEMRRANAELSIELGDRGGDLAFEPLFRVSGALHALPILQERFVVMMRATHALAGKSMTMSKYLAYPHILISPTGLPGSVVDDALVKLGKTRNVIAVLQHFTSAPIVAMRSDVLLTCPSWLAHAVADLIPMVTAAVPMPLPSYPIAAIWHERCHNDPAHVWLRNLVLQQAKDLS